MDARGERRSVGEELHEAPAARSTGVLLPNRTLLGRTVTKILGSLGKSEMFLNLESS